MFIGDDPAVTAIYPLSLHDALPILPAVSLTVTVSTWPSPTPEPMAPSRSTATPAPVKSVPLTSLITMLSVPRTEEHTSDLQSLRHLVCLAMPRKKRNRPPLAEMSMV